MAMTIHVDIVSVEAQIFSGTADMVIVPGMLGNIGIKPRHTALLTFLRPGQVRLVEGEDKEELFYVSGGVLEVQPYLVSILSDSALRAQDIDEAAALQAKQRAEQMIKDRREDYDYATVRAELARAIAQIEVLKRLHRQYTERA